MIQTTALYDNDLIISKWLRSLSDCVLYEEGEVKHINDVWPSSL